MANAGGSVLVTLLLLALMTCAVQAGDCPSIPPALSQNCLPHSSNDQCKYHADCTESVNHKCCKVGCQKICLDTVEIQTSVVGNSVCPSLPKPSPCPNKPNQCIDQRECGAGRKCCSNGCQMVCVEPVVVPTTKAYHTFEWKVCNSTVDIAFVVDSSGSISKSNYRKIKAFVKHVARSFGVSPTESRAGIVVYSTSASVKAHFGQYLTIDEFVVAVDRLPHERGYTRIDKALKVASTQLFPRARQDVPKIAMVLTDGEQTKSPDAVGLKEASEPLRRAGVRIVAFGIGKRVNVRELRLIVERDEDVIRVMKFDDLISRVRNYSASLCRAAETEPINPDADIIFLADSSTDVSMGQFDRQKRFVQRLAQYFIISPLGPRAAFVTYARTSHTVVDFTGYSSIADFTLRIDNAPLLGGTRRIDQALAHAANMFRQTGRVGMRIVILLTSGNYHTGPGSRSLSSALLPLRTLGAYLYLIGIGPYFSPSIFKQMVSGPSDIFQVPSFNMLGSWTPPIARQLRLSTNTLRYEAATFSSDAVFLMDSSRYVGSYNYILEKNFVKLLARLLNLAENGTRAALYAFSDRPQLQITFDGYENREAFDAAVNSAPYLQGSRRIDRAFETAAELFRVRSRPSAPKYVILLTTGTQTPAFDMRGLDFATRGLRSYGARVFVIAILTGGYTIRDFFGAIQDPNDGFSVPTYADLLPRAPSIASCIMATWRAPNEPHFAADVAFIVDSSSRLTPFQYTRAKRFVRILSKYLNVSPGKSRGAMLAFGESPMVVFNFDSYNSVTEFNSKVNDAPYLGGEAFVNSALYTAATLFSDARGSYPWISILLTNWRPDDIHDTRRLQDIARPLLNRGVWLYVLSIGQDRDVDWLRPMLVEPTDAFSVVSYRDLPPNIGPVSSYITKDKYLYGHPSFPSDIVFLVDSSSDVHVRELKIVKGFIQRIAMHLGIFANKSRAALVTYGDEPEIAFALGGYSSNSEFVSRLNEARIVGGDRRMDLGLDAAVTLLLSARSTMPKAVILFTAGNQSNTPNSRSLEAVAQQLHHLGAWVYVVAIGPDVDLDKLRKAALKPSDVFATRSFAELYGYIAPVAKYIVNTSVITGTSPLNADIAFVLDSSSSVPFMQYTTQKSFVRSLAQYLNIQPGQSRAALVLYGSRAMVASRFHSSIVRFNSAVSRASYLGGDRRVDKALQVTTGLFRDSRENFPKVVLLVIAGKQIQRNGVQSLQDAIRPLHQLGVRAYVVSIGSNLDVKEIPSALDRADDAFHFSDHSDLQERTPYIARHIPFYSALLAPLSFAADIVYLLDSSDDVTQENYGHEKDFVIYLARYLNTMPTRSRGAVVTYGSTPAVVSKFNEARRTQGFEMRLHGAPKQGGQRRMDLALDAASRMLTKTRPAIPKVVILLTAGKQTAGIDAGVLEESVQRVQNLGARVYVVTVNASHVTLPIKSSTGSNWFPVKSFAYLPILVVPMARHVVSDTAAIGPDDFFADVVFIIDSSSSITSADYGHEKNFVKLITKYLNVAPGKSRASVIFYSSTPAVVLPFDGYSTISHFNSIIDRASQLRGSRRTDLAFRAAAKLFESARPSARKIAILLTGGRQSTSGDALKEAVEPLRNLGVTTYVVAIDTTSDVPVDRPEDTFSVPSYDALPQHVEPIAREITKKRDEPKATYRADMVFIVDSSNESVSSYNLGKNLVKSLARYFNVDPQGSRAALIVFNGRPSVIADLDDFNSASDFSNTVDTAPYLGGNRGISEALGAAAGIFLKSDLSVSKIAFLVTPGEPIRGQQGRLVQEALQKLRAIGVRTYVALIGQAPHIEGFKTVVEDPGRLFWIKSLDDIPRQINDVGKRVLTDSATPKRLNLKMYLMFLIDASSGVSPTDFQREKDFIKSLIRYMNLYPANSRSHIGIVVYSDGASVVLNFDSKETKSDIENIVDNLPHLRGTRRIDKALRTAATTLNQISSDYPKFVVLLTAGRQTQAPDSESFGAAVRSLHDAGVTTHVLGIGDDIDPSDFRGGDKEMTEVISVPSFLDLPQYVNTMSRNLMEDYVPTRDSVEVQFCPSFSSPRGCPDLVTNECISHKDCSSPPFLCCNDGCRNMCFDISATTVAVPTTKESTTTKETTTTRRPTTTTTEKTIASQVPTTAEKITTTKRRTTMEVRNPAMKSTSTREPTKKATAIKTTHTKEKPVTVQTPLQRKTTVKVTEIPTTVTDKEPIVKRQTTPVLVKTTTEPITAQVKVAMSTPSDIVFLIDTSREVRHSDLAKQKEFVKRMAKYFGVAPANSHAAVMAYSDTTRLIAGFSHYTRGENFNDVVDSVSLTGGRRKIDQALERAGDTLTEARPSVPKIIVLLTQGRQAHEFGFPRLQVASRRLRDFGANLYVMGVGVKHYDTQLGPVVVKPGDFFGILSSSDLPSYAPSVAYYIASRTDGIVPKDFRADVIYVLDSSLLVGTKGFEIEKDFTKALARILNHNPTQTRSSVIVFDFERITFENYRGIGPFSEAVDKLPYIGGTHEIYLALGLASASVPLPRSGVPKVLVVVTNKEPASKRYMEYLAAGIREQELFVNVLGIGDKSDFRNLRLLTVSPDDFFTPKTFDDLMSHVPAVAYNIVARSTLYIQTPKPATAVPPTPTVTKTTTNVTTTRAATTTVMTTFSPPQTTEHVITKELKTPKYPSTSDFRVTTKTTTGETTTGLSTLSKTTPPKAVPPTPKAVEILACPVRFTNPCPGKHLCEHDRQCSLEEKCCRHTCGFFVCSAVRKREKPGSCPYLSRPSSCYNRPNECKHDDDCSGGLKCCSNGCGRVCVSTAYIPPPIDVAPGKCPPYTPRMNCPSLVQDECTCDSDCDAKSDYKCCYDGCRRLCRRKAGKVCTAKIDIIYLMDSSGSISDIDFQKQRDFVKDLVRIFNISPAGSRAGVVTYSDFPTVRAEFGRYESSEKFARAVDRIDHDRGRTRIDRALKKVSEMFESARKNVNKILIVLTDGRQTPDPNAVGLKKASVPLRERGVRTYAIGVGHDINSEELESMAGSKENVFTVDSFQDLVRQSQSIAERACHEVGAHCVQGVDIAFLMDSSESITGEDFEREKRAVKVIAQSFVQASKDSRAGVIMYSGQPELSVDFSRQSDFEQFKSEVDALPHRRSMTRIDRALRFASTSLFANPRPSVTSIAVIMTDGVQTPGSGVEPVSQAVLPLRIKGVRVLVVGVGPRVDLNELNSMAASKDDVFQMSSFQELLDKANQFLQAVCPSPTLDPLVRRTTKTLTTTATTTTTTTAATLPTTPFKTTPSTTKPRPICDEVLDIVFVMDSSRSITDSQYIREKDFVKELATIFSVGTGSRASVIIYSDDPQLKINFNEHRRLVDFLAAVDALPYLQRRTRIDKALRLASSVLQQARPGIPRAVILMTDGRQTRDQDAVPLDVAANAIYQQGARILVVGIGPKIVTDELLDIARETRFLFTVQSFENLIRAARDVAISACSNTVLPTTSSVVTKTSTEEPEGFCPLFPVPLRCLETTSTCVSDRDCLGKMKCCFDFCRFICARPDLPGPNPGPTTLSQTTIPGPKCVDAFDLGFAMDSSGSIRLENYQREKDFVKSMAERLVISPQDVQLGLVLFSDVPLISIRFGTLESTYWPSFSNAVDNLPYLRGRTRIDSALNTAATVLFPGGRQGKVPQVLFLMTDGRQSSDDGAIELMKAVKPLRDQRIKVIAIGIGNDIDEQELEAIVENPKDDIFLVSSFRNLRQLLDDNRLIEALCISAKKLLL